MRESLVEVLTGTGVIIAAAAFLAWGASVAGFSPGGSNIELTASFRSVEGVAPGSEVRMAGVQIGTVGNIALDPETYRAETVLLVNGSVPIPEDSSAIIASEGLLGGNYVEITPGASFAYFADGAEIVDTQGAVSLLNLLLTYVGGGSGDEAE